MTPIARWLARVGNLDSQEDIITILLEAFYGRVKKILTVQGRSNGLNWPILVD
jgi:hypothetical protein